jgi:hypothetical protein
MPSLSAKENGKSSLHAKNPIKQTAFFVFYPACICRQVSAMEDLWTNWPEIACYVSCLARQMGNLQLR